ncbi:hypothetical protein GDO78_006433 [Eleutherodactylus coqui]|uniref:Uncharacterized protein n=1 Tax=Eleutherodactylus coqui TaxID=57060 RepID=A0A8J6FNA2_ELECQ|nr:hypothetical protein GDO78_006433 [Eleutherodactylus coqui]
MAFSSEKLGTLQYVFSNPMKVFHFCLFSWFDSRPDYPAFLYSDSPDFSYYIDCVCEKAACLDFLPAYPCCLDFACTNLSLFY